jgi:hypothetical protein
MSQCLVRALILVVVAWDTVPNAVPFLALADLRMGRWDTWDTGVEAAGQPPEAARIGQALEVAAGVLAELLLYLGDRHTGRVLGDERDDLGGAVTDSADQPGLAGAGCGLIEVRAVQSPLTPRRRTGARTRPLGRHGR